MTSSYEDIYSCFLGKITDYKIASLDETDAIDLMNGWMKSVVAQPYIRRIFSNVICDDVEEKIDFELKIGIDEASDISFANEIISRGMVIEWLEPQVKSVVNTAQMFGGKDQKWYSQAQHLSELKDMLKTAKSELRRMICDYGYINNSYVNGE